MLYMAGKLWDAVIKLLIMSSSAVKILASLGKPAREMFLQLNASNLHKCLSFHNKYWISISTQHPQRS